MKSKFICQNENGNYGELNHNPSKDLGISSSTAECKFICERSFQDESGCCSRKSNGRCWWYPKSTTNCCWADSYSTTLCTTIEGIMLSNT